MNKGTLQTTVHQKIAKVTFSHPAGNSLPSHLLLQLANEFEQLSLRDDVQVIVLKSEGNRAFCAGASFDELLEVSNEADGIRFFRGFAHVLNAMRSCTKIIIGSVQGKTVGGGVGLAAACDVCYATDAAAIKLSELSLGIGPFVIEPAVQRKIGTAAFCKLTLEASHWHAAEWAEDKGLYAKVFPTQEALEQAVDLLAEELSQSSLDAMAALKKIFWKGTDSWPILLTERAEISGKLVLSEQTKAALAQFKK